MTGRISGVRLDAEDLRGAIERSFVGLARSTSRSTSLAEELRRTVKAGIAARQSAAVGTGSRTAGACAVIGSWGGVDFGGIAVGDATNEGDKKMIEITQAELDAHQASVRAAMAARNAPRIVKAATPAAAKVETKFWTTRRGRARRPRRPPRSASAPPSRRSAVGISKSEAKALLKGHAPAPVAPSSATESAPASNPSREFGAPARRVGVGANGVSFAVQGADNRLAARASRVGVSPEAARGC